jgi:hypothetical protein
MAVTDASAHGAYVSEDGRYDVERHWRELNNNRRLYTIGGLVALASRWSPRCGSPTRPMRASFSIACRISSISSAT